jgi:hypothetical protein
MISRITFISLIVLALAISQAYPHDKERPDLDDWFNHLQSRKGLCCHDHDGTPLHDLDWDMKNGHYRVRLDVSKEAGKIDMQWIEVPEEAIVTEPNKAGHAMVWYYNGYNGLVVRCFMPGSLT